MIPTTDFQLFDSQGKRKYLDPEERKLFEETANKLDRVSMTFCNTLLHTGGRISEVLELSPERFDLVRKEVVLRSLKKRSKKPVYRAIPIPDRLLRELKLVHDLEKLQKDPKEKKLPLWNWKRINGWKKVKKVMELMGFEHGDPKASPKGLRHGLGVHLAMVGVPESQIQKILGHSSPQMTAIYTNVLGQEKRDLISKIW